MSDDVLVMLACLFSLALLTATEDLAPRDLVPGTLAVLPVVLAAARLNGQRAALVVVAAVALRLSLIGDDGTGALTVSLDTAAYVLGAVLTRAAVRRLGAPGLPVAALPTPEPAVAAAPALGASPAPALASSSGPLPAAPGTLPPASAPAAVAVAASPEPLPTLAEPASGLLVLEQRSGPEGPLTPRQREVVQLAAQGFTSSEIAAHLVISRRTVETHLAASYPKVGVRSKRELMRSHLRQAQADADAALRRQPRPPESAVS